MPPFPKRQEIIDFIAAQETKVGKREIAKAFNIKGDARVALKKILRELAAEGYVHNDRRAGLYLDGKLPPVGVLRITARDSDGVLCAAVQQHGDVQKSAAQIRIDESGGSVSKRASIGDTVLARLEESRPGHYRARIIRKIGDGTRKIVGILRKSRGGARVISADRRQYEYQIDDASAADDGDVVTAETTPAPRHRARKARIIERIGAGDDPHAFSLICLAEQGIRDAFPSEVTAEAEAAALPDGAARQDLTALPFITIDPPDARDHDDAVCALPDPDQPDGHIVWVAIADVAALVPPDSALDREARRRGNTTYLPDRAVPMLPERISTDLCSLRENAPRPCLAVAMKIDAQGRKTGHEFCRATIKVQQGLSYEEAQAAQDSEAFAALWRAYRAMAAARDARAPLRLARAERRITLDAQGQISHIDCPPQLEAHRLIEEMMIAANICAAEQLERARLPLIYRVHDAPSREKMHMLASFAKPLGLRVDLGQPITPHLFNRLLARAESGAHYESLVEIVLRTQAQAIYSPDNIGHFGLNLARYAHFTSPIRRYSDLIIHRGLIRALKLGTDGLRDADIAALPSIAETCSQAERRSMLAERAAADRYVSAYMAEQIGAEFAARISGISRAGLFIRLDENGADGLIPMSRLGGRLRADPNRLTLSGNGKRYRIGDAVRVTLTEASPLQGGLIFAISRATKPRHPYRRRQKAG